MAKLQATFTLLLLTLLLITCTSAAPVLPEEEESPNTHTSLNLTPRAEPFLKWKGNVGKVGLLPIYDGPYCVPHPERPVCTFATRSAADHKETEWFAYDHWCKLIGHRNYNPLPNEHVGFFTELPGLIVSSQTDHAKPPSLVYEGKTYNEAFCYDGGQAREYPAFRLACRIEFDCPPKKI